MEKNMQDNLFKELSDQYVELYGAELKKEMQALEQNNVAYITPKLDARIRDIQKSDKRQSSRRYARGFAALAACLLLLLLVPWLLNRQSGFSKAPASSAAPPAPEEVQEYAVAEGPSVVTPEADAQAATGSAGEPGMLPILFALPANFTVEDAKLDNGKSVYYLKNSMLDDVVLTMELNAREDFSGMRELTINGETAWAASTPDYQMLATNRGDITYTFTCKYDINTLIPLCESV